MFQDLTSQTPEKWKLIDGNTEKKLGQLKSVIKPSKLMKNTSKKRTNENR